MARQPRCARGAGCSTRIVAAHPRVDAALELVQARPRSTGQLDRRARSQRNRLGTHGTHSSAAAQPDVETADEPAAEVGDLGERVTAAAAIGHHAPVWPALVVRCDGSLRHDGWPTSAPLGGHGQSVADQSIWPNSATRSTDRPLVAASSVHPQHVGWSNRSHAGAGASSRSPRHVCCRCRVSAWSR